MHSSSHTPATIDARVESVLPGLGLAYVSDGEQRWGVTRAALGERFEALSPGTRVRLELQQHRGSSLVRDCRAIA